MEAARRRSRGTERGGRATVKRIGAEVSEEDGAATIKRTDTEDGTATVKTTETEAIHQNGAQRVGSTATINQTDAKEEVLEVEGEEGRGRRRGRRRRRRQGGEEERNGW